MMHITVGGLPGSGTSTLCKLLQSHIGLPYTYAGRLFREEAADRNLSLAEFGALCQKDARVDMALDAKQVGLLEGDPLILEGRLSGWLAHHNELPALKVWITCDLDERLRRITERDGSDVETQRATTLAREQSEADRYMRYYHAQLSDLTIYDLVIDSTQRTPEELAQAVIAAHESLEHSGDVA